MKIKINHNPYELELNQLMVIGKRSRNPKRNFLFISKVLGKHLEVRPDVCRVVGYLLASLKYGQTKQTDAFIHYINEPTLDTKMIREAMNVFYEPHERVAVLGFAETATGLGMAVASAIKGSYYLHTTREAITQYESLLQFEEEHSHATTHRCYPMDQEQLKTMDRLILVDDELTTGKSLLNMIEALIHVIPIRKFTALSILDWRTEEHRQLVREFCETFEVEIEIQALLCGEVMIEDETMYEDEQPEIINQKQSTQQLQLINRLGCETSQGVVNYYAASGRFGVSQVAIIELEQICQQLASEIQMRIGEAKKILVLGHGEDIYLPSRVASYLEGDVFYKSTTRSPIYCEEDGIMKKKHLFYDGEVPYYFYNKDEIEATYDQVIWITERELNIQLTKQSLNVCL